jgi:hypothetical protein
LFRKTPRDRSPAYRLVDKSEQLHRSCKKVFVAHAFIERGGCRKVLHRPKGTTDAADRKRTTQRFAGSVLSFPIAFQGDEARGRVTKRERKAYKVRAFSKVLRRLFIQPECLFDKARGELDFCERSPRNRGHAKGSGSFTSV